MKTREILIDCIQSVKEKHYLSWESIDIKYLVNEYLQSQPQPRQSAEEFFKNKFKDNDKFLQDGWITHEKCIELMQEYANQIELPTDEEVLKEALTHSKTTFQNILKTWDLTENQKHDIKTNIHYLEKIINK